MGGLDNSIYILPTWHGPPHNSPGSSNIIQSYRVFFRGLPFPHIRGSSGRSILSSQHGSYEALCCSSLAPLAFLLPYEARKKFRVLVPKIAEHCFFCKWMYTSHSNTQHIYYICFIVDFWFLSNWRFSNNTPIFSHSDMTMNWAGKGACSDPQMRIAFEHQTPQNHKRLSNMSFVFVGHIEPQVLGRCSYLTNIFFGYEWWDTMRRTGTYYS